MWTGLDPGLDTVTPRGNDSVDDDGRARMDDVDPRAVLARQRQGVLDGREFGIERMPNVEVGHGPSPLRFEGRTASIERRRVFGMDERHAVERRYPFERLLQELGAVEAIQLSPRRAGEYLDPSRSGIPQPEEVGEVIGRRPAVQPEIDDRCPLAERH